ncbi:hypothetical protein KKG22_02400 [Patescibacteria group bacterium]|nr:hypothetical protein [Patescibacteria group bacterium]MBU1721797.1 hypothetical protein [Patescibacteria group bacterium]
MTEDNEKINKPHIFQIISSMLFGFVFTILSKGIGTKCTISDTGGIIEGWGGFPIPFYWCGVWGEEMSYILFGLNVLLLSLIIYMLIQFLKKYVNI